MIWVFIREAKEIKAFIDGVKKNIVYHNSLNIGMVLEFSEYIGTIDLESYGSILRLSLICLMFL